MKIPLSWLKEYVTLPAKITSDQISQAFVKVGFEIESIEAQGADLKGPLVVGKVLSIEELSEHKKPIRFVGLDVGEKKTRYVICGARNFKVNDLVVVALPGALLPGDFKISARETYGKISDGMICSVLILGGRATNSCNQLKGTFISYPHQNFAKNEHHPQQCHAYL